MRSAWRGLLPGSGRSSRRRPTRCVTDCAEPGGRGPEGCRPKRRPCVLVGCRGSQCCGRQVCIGGGKGGTWALGKEGGSWEDLLLGGEQAGVAGTRSLRVLHIFALL